MTNVHSAIDTTRPLHLGHPRRVLWVHLTLLPLPVVAMWIGNWEVIAVVLFSFILGLQIIYSFFFAINRHVTIDPIKRTVLYEKLQWGLSISERREASFDDFVAVRYYTYMIMIEDNGQEVPDTRHGLYLLHRKMQQWRCGDSGMLPGEPLYFRNTAVTVAQMMGLPLEESDDHAQTYRPKIKKSTCFK